MNGLRFTLTIVTNLIKRGDPDKSRMVGKILTKNKQGRVDAYLGPESTCVKLCLAKYTQNVGINLQETFTFICMQKIKSINFFS